MLKKGDILLILLVLLMVPLSLVGMKYYNSAGSGGNSVLVIKQDGRVVKKLNLDTVKKPERITVQGKYRNVLLVEKGRARFEDADCPDQICVKTGWISKNGDTAVCLPNRTIAKIEGEKSEVDAVSY